MQAAPQIAADTVLRLRPRHASEGAHVLAFGDSGRSASGRRASGQTYSGSGPPNLANVVGFSEVVWELWTFGYPLVLPETAFGTYTQPTVVGLVPLLLASFVVAVAGALGFWRPGLAGALFVASAMTFVPSVVAPGEHFPPSTSIVMLVAFVLPLLDVAALLLATWWAQRRGIWRHRDIADAASSVPHVAGT